MDVEINKIDAVSEIIIDGAVIPNVVSYQVISSESGETELTLCIRGKVNLFELSASLIEQRQLSL